MSRIDLDAIRARLEAATPAPWIVGGLDELDERGFCNNDGLCMDSPEGGDYCAECEMWEWNTSDIFLTPSDSESQHLKLNDANVEFIAHARQDIPDLLNALEAEKARMDGFEKFIEAAHNMSEIDDDKILIYAPESEIVKTQAEALKELSAELDELKKENQQWNDTDCSTCPLNHHECCEMVCSSKLSMAEALSETIDNRDKLEDEISEATTECIKYKVRAEALEKALKELRSLGIDNHVLCRVCKNGDYCICEAKDCGFEFDQDRFACEGDDNDNSES
ncbi:MAG: hypothetical protein FWE05_05960 [Defluviitaleaceae bacterium]|nr:hypothetical protein [Defluviitaleaceae bacterium]